MMSLQGSSKGNQEKLIESSNFIKFDTPGWHECLAEVLSSELQLYIRNAKPFVDYSLLERDNRYGCICKNFLSDGEKDISLYKLLHNSYYNIDYTVEPKELLNTITGILNMEYSLNISEYLSYLVSLDALLLNPDRHLNNICFIKGIDNQLRPAPVFDNGMGLGSYKETISGSTLAQPFNLSFDTQIHIVDRYNLIIDYSGFYERVCEIYANVGDYVYTEVQEKALVKMMNLLTHRLVETEGILWNRV